MPETLTKKEIDALATEYQPQCSIQCDEMHAHSALQGCVVGSTKETTIICKLIETVRELEDRCGTAGAILDGRA